MKPKKILINAAFVILMVLVFAWINFKGDIVKEDNNVILASGKADLSIDEQNIREWHIQKFNKIVKKSIKLNGEYLDYVMNTYANIPVLMYHSINKEKGNQYRLPKEVFEKHMSWIHEQGFNTLTIEEYYNIISTGKGLPKKPILITFDDGYKDNYTNAFPIMKKYNIKGTIFVITQTIDTASAYLDSNEIKDLQSNNIDIECHTVTHRPLDSLSYEDQLKELKDSKIVIDKLLNKNTISVAYPYGKFNKNTLRACKEAGFMIGFTTSPGYSNYYQGMLKLKRIAIYASTTLEQLEILLM